MKWWRKTSLMDKLSLAYGFTVVVVGGAVWLWLAYRGLTRP